MFASPAKWNPPKYALEPPKAIEAPRYDPRHFPHFNLARVHIQRYEYGEAIEHLRRALELDPQYGSARRELQRILTRMN